jgi:hypothetical protein
LEEPRVSGSFLVEIIGPKLVQPINSKKDKYESSHSLSLFMVIEDIFIQEKKKINSTL